MALGESLRSAAMALLLRQRREAGYAIDPRHGRLAPAEFVGPAVALAETTLRFAEQAIIGYPDAEYELWWKQIAAARDALRPLTQSMEQR